MATARRLTYIDTLCGTANNEVSEQEGNEGYLHVRSFDKHNIMKLRQSSN